jgi:hypothetical protein
MRCRLGRFYRILVGDSITMFGRYLSGRSNCFIGLGEGKSRLLALFIKSYRSRYSSINEGEGE